MSKASAPAGLLVGQLLTWPGPQAVRYWSSVWTRGHRLTFSPGCPVCSLCLPLPLQSYCNGAVAHHCASSQPYNVAVSDVTFYDIHGDMDPMSDLPAVYFDCSEHAPCDDVKLGKIAISGSRFDPKISYAIVNQIGSISPSLPRSNIKSISGSQWAKIKAMKSQCPK